MSTLQLLVAFALPLATVIAIVASAPSLKAGIDRLKLVSNLLGLFLLVVLAGSAAVLFVWGIVAGDKGLVYFALLPMIGAFLLADFITRRHATWWSLFGFNDRSERWQAFWNETISLWRSAGSPAAPSADQRPCDDNRNGRSRPRV